MASNHAATLRTFSTHQPAQVICTALRGIKLAVHLTGDAELIKNIFATQHGSLKCKYQLFTKERTDVLR
jgi:hypothetical protein